LIHAHAQVLILAVAVLAFAAGAVAGRTLRPPGPPAVRPPGRDGTRRILLPFTGTSISRRSLEAAVRLARAEDATIMPAFLARVPRHLPLDAPLPSQCLQSMPLLETIEQRVVAKGIAVDARVGRGRSYRDALRSVIEHEPVDRIIVQANGNPRTGLNAEDLQWLLSSKVPAEVLILRPDPEDHRTVTAGSMNGHF
jgi:hypothetical protein